MYDLSAQGLHDLCKHYFEAFGFMIIAHRDGHIKIVKSYCENIELLIKRVDEKIKHLMHLNKNVNDVNMIVKIDEFKIMKENLLTLHMHSVKLCKSK